MKWFVNCVLRLILTGVVLFQSAYAAEPPESRSTARTGPSPLNIVFILCDDLGYGDVKCNNPEGKIATPSIDRLAAAGMRFTDAHSTSSVCTPTRYGILTGRYNWRSTLQKGVLSGLSPPLIEPGRLTVAELLRRNGYHTACIGKWHLGMNWPRQTGGSKSDGNAKITNKDIDYKNAILGGPISVGFDYFYGITASLDMPPFTFIENDRVTVIPTVEKQWVRKGPAAADFEAIDVLPTLTRKAIEYIAHRSDRGQAGKPFFLYLALTSPHTPILPSPEWQGRSGLNSYGDFVMQTDDCIGQVIEALEKRHYADDTLVIVASDNGCSPAADLNALHEKGHYPSYVFRGHKADIWDGGHRIPLVIRWPGKIQPGATCDQLVCLMDFMATCAEIVGAKLPDNAAEDSVSLLPVLLGKNDRPPRETLVHHSIEGKFSIRQGRWKLELCPGSGGWGAPKDPQALKEGLPTIQLYDMSQDIGEQRNLQAEHPEVVKELTALLEKYVANGRSTPGDPQKNDVRVNIWKLKAAQPDGAAAAVPE
jgi:arylsulfatase A